MNNPTITKPPCILHRGNCHAEHMLQDAPTDLSKRSNCNKAIADKILLEGCDRLSLLS
ncbi:MAG: hypothetical protein KME52_30455 [Desmonostoc geniculatum HA4340-LM1]|nr:hypothetical protein [Desmonostoc geniculatum HA4340-LM1]